MNLSKPVSTIMTSELITVPDDTPLKKLKNMFKRKGVHHILVEDADRQLLGVVSTEDFVRSAHFPVKEEELLARHIMTATPTTVKKETTIHEVLELFLDNYFRCLPVLDQTNRLAGIVTPYDVMALMAGRVEAETFEL
jgi:CBS domain-containing protein